MEAEAATTGPPKMQKLLSAFKIFVKEVKKEFAGRPVDKGQPLAAGLSEKWRKLSEVEKQAYYDKYAQLKRRERTGPEDVVHPVRPIEPPTSSGVGMDSYHSPSFASGDASSSHMLQMGPKAAPEHGDKLDQKQQLAAGPKKKRSRKKADGSGLSKKRGPNAFVLFASEMRRKVPGQWTGREAMGLLAERWRRTPGTQKDRFYQQSLRLREERKESASEPSSQGFSASSAPERTTSPPEPSTSTWSTMTTPLIDQVFAMAEMSSRSHQPPACACRNPPVAANTMWPASSLGPYSHFPQTMTAGMNYPYMGGFSSMLYDSTFWMFRQSMYPPISPYVFPPFWQPPFGGLTPSALGEHGGYLENATPQLRSFEATSTTENDSNFLLERDDNDTPSSSSNDLLIDVVDDYGAEEA